MDDDSGFDQVAAMDQVLRAMKDIAKGLFAYYSALREEGFSETEALMLAAQWQNQLLSNALEQ